ncbi:hypothetical protein F4777DRAFT_557863 [Nemania sp. FL0916]|nr:hypothetical protein F4777DRAFT_557863 [Nemania sp. FL0916]
MVFPIIALSIADPAYTAVFRIRDSGCAVHLQPSQSPPSSRGNIIRDGMSTRLQSSLRAADAIDAILYVL